VSIFCAKELSDCLVDGAMYDIYNNVLKFSASMLSIDRTPATFYFYAQMSGHDGQNVVHLVPVTVVLGDPPVVSVSCTANCEPEVNVSTALLLAAECLNCAYHERLRYLWTVDIVNKTSGDGTPVGQHGKRFTLDVRSLNRSTAFHIVRLTGL